MTAAPVPVALDYSTTTSRPGRAATIGGWVMGGLPAAFLVMDGGMKLFKPSFVVEAVNKMNWPESFIVPMGVILLASTLLYLVPRTAALGAILLTGYLGGAVAAHVQLRDPMWTQLFPVAFGALLWGGLVLRDRRLRAVLPFRSN